MDEREIIAAAADALEALWTDGTTVVEVHDVEAHGRGRRPDATLWLEVAGERYGFDVEVKRQVNVAAAVHLAERADTEADHSFLLIAEYVQPAVAEALRERGVSYADAAGNCHVERDPLLLHVEGRKRQRVGAEEPVRAFGGEGLKAIFALLLEPDYVARPYREIAQLSGASHGVVQYTVKDLERLGFLLRLSRTERRLRDTDALLERWAAGYTEALRPKLALGTFRFTSADRASRWETVDLDPDWERWGGEPAAAAATDYLKPAKLTVYARGTRSETMKRLRVVPDERGDVEVLRAFWPEGLERELPDAFPDARVPDVLAYADLVASGDPRNAEVAATLQERIGARASRG